MVFVQIQGLNKTLQKLKNVGEVYKQKVNEVLQEGAEKIKEDAIASMKEGLGKPSSPGSPPNKQSYDLANSIEIKKAGTTIAVGSEVDHAAYMEFGTRYIEPRPWLKPAYRKNIDAIKTKLTRIKY